MLTLGLVASGGSDMPVANANPWEGVRALVVREIEGLVGKRIIGPDERLSILDALRVYTYNGAFGDFAENRWGSIEIGKAADFVFVSHDVTSMSPAEIVDVQTVATYVGGQCVYAAGILD